MKMTAMRLTSALLFLVSGAKGETPDWAPFNIPPCLTNLSITIRGEVGATNLSFTIRAFGEKPLFRVSGAGRITRDELVDLSIRNLLGKVSDLQIVPSEGGRYTYFPRHKLWLRTMVPASIFKQGVEEMEAAYNLSDKSPFKSLRDRAFRREAEGLKFQNPKLIYEARADLEELAMAEDSLSSNIFLSLSQDGFDLSVTATNSPFWGDLIVADTTVLGTYWRRKIDVLGCATNMLLKPGIQGGKVVASYVQESPLLAFGISVNANGIITGLSKKVVKEKGIFPGQNITAIQGKRPAGDYSALSLLNELRIEIGGKEGEVVLPRLIGSKGEVQSGYVDFEHSPFHPKNRFKPR